MAEINGFACARALFGILDFPLGSQKPGENQIEMKITHCALRRCFVLFMLTHNNLSLFFTHSLTFWRYRSLFLFSIFGFHFVRSRSCFFLLSHELVCYHFGSFVCVCHYHPISCKNTFYATQNHSQFHPFGPHRDISLNVLLYRTVLYSLRTCIHIFLY